MRAIVLDKHPRFVSDYQTPSASNSPMNGVALVRVTRAGVCNTDVELCKGYMTFRGVLGHEFVGKLEDGTRVVGEINITPIQSRSRNWFERAQDATRTTVGIDRHDGAFADYISLPHEVLHRVPDSVSDDEAVFVEPLAAACAILESVHIKPTDRVVVLGDGKLGLLCAMVAATTGCQLTVIGKHDNKLALLRPRARTMLLSEWQGDRIADVVIECTGSPSGFDTARRMLKPRGTLVLKSTYSPVNDDTIHAINALNQWQQAMTMVVVDEQTVVGSRCGPFDAALRLLAEKRVDVTPLIHSRFPLEQGVQALEHAQAKGVLKVLLDIA